jgi:thioredoxin reductase
VTDDLSCDVAVVGGSVAGLQAALTLGRARWRVVVFDDGHPRNAPAAHVHNFFGQEAPTPAALLATGRRLLEPYDVTVVSDRIVDARPVKDSWARFELSGADGRSWRCRSVVLATGLRDELPDVPGVAESWGREVVACPHCHGWEVRDQPLGELGLRGLPTQGVERALLLSRWSQDIVFFTDGDELEPADFALVAARGITVRTDRVRAVRPHEGGVAVRLDTGESVGLRAVFAVVRQHQQSDLASRLGCRVAPESPGAVEADVGGRTTVPGVWAAGTTTRPGMLAIGAAGHGGTVGTMLNAELLADDLAALRARVTD